MAKFWRWAVRQDTSDPHVKDFVVDTVDLLYNGADLGQLQESIARGCLEARNVYNRLRHQFGFEISDKTVSSRLGFMAGQIEVPDDFDNMGSPEIEQVFRGSEGVRLLLDTHILLWAAGDPGRLTPEARSLLDDPATELLFSTASIWKL